MLIFFHHIIKNITHIPFLIIGTKFLRSGQKVIKYQRKSDYNYETELFDNRIKTYNELLSLFSFLFLITRDYYTTDRQTRVCKRNMKQKNAMYNLSCIHFMKSDSTQQWIFDANNGFNLDTVQIQMLPGLSSNFYDWIRTSFPISKFARKITQSSKMHPGFSYPPDDQRTAEDLSDFGACQGITINEDSDGLNAIG